MATTATSGSTFLVEKALRGEGPAEWVTVSGYSSRQSASAEVRQLRGSYSRKGYSLRVVEV